MNIKNIVSRRSFIFCPGLRPDMFPKAVNSGTDIVCIELEDGIAPKDKDQARKLTLDLFTSPLDGKGAELIVRINSVRDEFGLADIEAILKTSSPPPAIMLSLIHI